ncbi:hypothetical protein SERLADRAFT_438532 [Serpula lacrymans var. lacrymans S7.9]|uniref:Uncharacterized protein n=1 Tax=Serpula lacrymans var. lacrymans (strain S7.9) TaxID=578457 RepID=F8NVZ8_SERL9|nr:uncharacterized protein SERLADRAFT_438532 [Serpula lacrymans var. lacrymans S7.9]EGO24932.1 hypothetical protein SERLADRAFT_438532 [Serpula lacrymans var. lacrymans S7.9]
MQSGQKTRRDPEQPSKEVSRYAKKFQSRDISFCGVIFRCWNVFKPNITGSPPHDWEASNGTSHGKHGLCTCTLPSAPPRLAKLPPLFGFESIEQFEN